MVDCRDVTPLSPRECADVTKTDPAWLGRTSTADNLHEKPELVIDLVWIGDGGGDSLAE